MELRTQKQDIENIKKLAKDVIEFQESGWSVNAVIQNSTYVCGQAFAREKNCTITKKSKKTVRIICIKGDLEIAIVGDAKGLEKCKLNKADSVLINKGLEYTVKSLSDKAVYMFLEIEL